MGVGALEGGGRIGQQLLRNGRFEKPESHRVALDLKPESEDESRGYPVVNRLARLAELMRYLRSR